MNEKILENEKRKGFWKYYFWLLFAVFFTSLGFWIGVERGRSNQTLSQEEKMPLIQSQVINQDSGKNENIDFSLFWKVWDLLKEKYVDSSQLDAKELFYGAIKGMLRATNDPYTTFLDPEDNQQFNEDITGSFEGIGAELGMKKGILTIIAPLEGSPAERAGLRAGDKIIKIDEENAAEISIDESVSKIRGAKGSQVKLTVFRNGDDETREIVITRDVINVKSVEFELKEDNIVYFKIIRFGENTNREFALAVKEMSSYEIKGIILDVRNNPGGYLDAAINMASKMIPKGEVIVIEEDSKSQHKEIKAVGGDVLSQIETVVLINVGSASASEILAGALRDNRDNVEIVGETSYGKGSVQELVELPQETAVKITVAKWLTPSGDQINEKGINPDVEIELTYEDYENDLDPQMDKALEILKSE